MNESGADSVAWPLVLAVVVTHNGRRWLPGCLKSLAMQTYPAMEVVVVDAASEDPDAVRRLVGRLLPTASLLRIERNVGYGAAANRALELSPDARSAEFYLFLHDDVALDRDCVGMLVAGALETGAGVVGGKGLSWDEPEVLLEVGMSADEFGYPVSGLEEREIDQGQHDTRREVLFVTSACMLVSRDTVERCGSWDAGYFLFGEDLDLCVRARLCGFPVVVTPAAVFYHAVALATGRREGPPKDPIRYFTRRNRLRTIAKNASATRVLLLIALYTGLVGAEAVLLAALRRFDEIPPYLKAYGWFLRSLPDVGRRRRAVQRRRKVPDRRVRRYQVRELPRARIFLERRLMEWGAGTMRFGQKTFSMFTPSALTARAGRWARSPGVLAGGTIVVVLIIAARHALLGPPVGAGTIWPFPAAMHQLLTDYLAAWRDVGLGTGAPPPPSLPLMWLASAVAIGNAGLAQKVLIGALLVAGLAGMYRFMRRRTSFLPAQLVAVGVYALAPVLRLGMVTADLGALTLFATGPYLLEAGLRLLGPVPGSGPGPLPGTHAERPPVLLTTDALSRQAVRLGLLTALIIALAPSALVPVAVVWLLAGIHVLGSARAAERARSAATGYAPGRWGAGLAALRAATGGAGEPPAAEEPLATGVAIPPARPGEVGRRLGWLLASLAAGVVLLVPWSIPALGRGGAILGPLLAGLGGGSALHALWARVDFVHALLLAPGVSVLAGALTAAALGGALLVASTSRRREVRLLATVVLFFGLWAGLVAKGWFPAPTATPGLWLALPLVALAASSGYFVAGLSEDITRHVAGWRQPVGALAAAVFAAGALGGWLPSLLSWSAPPASAVAGTGSQSDADVLAAVQAAGYAAPRFRVVWLGSVFVNPLRAGLRPQAGVPYVLTGAQGMTVLDSSPPAPGPAGNWLSGVLGDLVGNRTHLAAHLLATAGVRFLVVDHADPAVIPAVLRQQDFALTQEIAGIDLYQNLDALPLATTAPASLAGPASTGAGGPESVLLAQWTPGAAFRRLSPGAFTGPASGGLPVLLAEASSASWRATLNGRSLPRAPAFGWANSFAVPAGAKGTVDIDYRGEWTRLIWVVLELALLALAAAMASGSRRSRAAPGAPAPPSPGPRPGPLARAARPVSLPAGTRRRLGGAEAGRGAREAERRGGERSEGAGGEPEEGRSMPRPPEGTPWRRLPPAPRLPWPGLGTGGSAGTRGTEGPGGERGRGRDSPGRRSPGRDAEDAGTPGRGSPGREGRGSEGPEGPADPRGWPPGGPGTR